MDSKRLDELEALCAAATPGPWRSTWSDPPNESDLDETIVESMAPDLPRPVDRFVVGSLWYDGPHTGCSEPNAALIAESRTAIPELCAEVRRLRAQVSELEPALVTLGRIADAFAVGQEGVPGERLDKSVRRLLCEVTELRAFHNAAERRGEQRGLERADLACMNIAREYDNEAVRHDENRDAESAADAAIERNGAMRCLNAIRALKSEVGT